MTSSSSNKDNQTVKDHHGKEYGSFELMCKAWHTDSYTVRSRLNRGWSLERALVEKVNKTNGGSSCKDHLGNQYKSKMAMCRAYGISYNVFTYRIRDGGMSIEEALTTPVKKQKDAIYDKSGNFLGYGVSRTAVKYNMCRE